MLFDKPMVLNFFVFSLIWLKTGMRNSDEVLVSNLRMFEDSSFGQ